MKNMDGFELISRQAVIDALLDWAEHSITAEEDWHLRQVIGDIRSMPAKTDEQLEELVSLRNPKKIVYKSLGFFTDRPCCPRCDYSFFDYEEWSYCPYCGQALDWRQGD